MDDYATRHDPHAMRFAEMLLIGLDVDTKRALMTRLIGEGALPILDALAPRTATEHERCAAVWDVLVKTRPGYMPLASEAVKR